MCVCVCVCVRVRVRVRQIRNHSQTRGFNARLHICIAILKYLHWEPDVNGAVFLYISHEINVVSPAF